MIYFKHIGFIVIRQVKFLKYIVFVNLVLNVMLYFSTSIHLVVYIYKTRQIFLLFASKSDTLISRYILGNACIVIVCISGFCLIKNMTYI